jgi:hypothetical protein
MPTGQPLPVRPPRTGWTSNPDMLAAGAAGCAASVCTLWAMEGLPFGSFLLWLSPLPLFLAGLGFGFGAALAGSVLATLIVFLLGNGAAALVFIALFAVPVPLLLGLAQQGGGPLRLSAPLLMLGIWPLAVLLLTAAWLAGEGGLEATMRRVVESVLLRLGVAAGDALISLIVRINAAAFGLIAAVALVLNAMLAQRMLRRRGLARYAPQPLAQLRLPTWYPLLLVLGAGAVILAPVGRDAVAISALLLLLLPAFFLGIAGVHLRAGGRPGRVPMLGLFYVLLVVFLQFMAPAMVALGLFDHFRRGRAAPT